MTESRIYRGMNRDALDAAYSNSKAVDDFEAVMSEFRARSRRTYQTRDCRRDLVYGPRARQRYDFISCNDADAGTFIFIHGGYWQSCDKEDFAFVAEGPLAAGYNVVLAEYTLAPDASMTRIVEEIDQLLNHLAEDRDRLGILGRPLILGGHSAGGHLTAAHRGHPAISGALMVSALVDLEPISCCWLNDKLRLTEHEIANLSPLRHVAAGAPTVIAVGARELPELVRHSTEYALALEMAGEVVGLMHVPNRDHFSILDDLASLGGWQFNALMGQL